MSRSFVSLIEKGCHGVDVLRLLRLAGVLGVAADRAARLDTPVLTDRHAA